MLVSEGSHEIVGNRGYGTHRPIVVSINAICGDGMARLIDEFIYDRLIRFRRGGGKGCAGHSGSIPNDAVLLPAPAVEELLLRDLAILDGEEGGLFHLHALAGHGAGLGGHVQGEVHDEAVAQGPGAFGGG
jgi:hypothetical protein